MRGFITDEGKALVSGELEDGRTGDFVLDARGMFIPQDRIHINMMFQFTAEQIEFEDWTQSEVVKNAQLLKKEHKFLHYLPLLQDQSSETSFRKKIAQGLDKLLKDERIYEKIVLRFDLFLQRSAGEQPIIPRDIWNYEDTITLAESVNAKTLVKFLKESREKGIF